MSLLGFSVLMLITTVITLCAIAINDKYTIIIAIILLTIVVIESSFIITYINYAPTALDVYKGKTELRITYDGKIPVDSVVIYKKGGEQ